MSSTNGANPAQEVQDSPASPMLEAALAHGKILHGYGGARPGHVAVRTSGEGSRRERAYPAGELAEVLPYYAGRSDVYISTQRFWGWRRISLLAECGALAVDIDFYKAPGLKGSHPLGVLEDCRVALERARKPQPSIAISSGRGLYLMWLHEPVPRGALPRWNACQRELWEVLKPLGADRGALDAARVLRLPGTRHSGAGVMVEALPGGGEVWDFDSLANEVLPHTREEIADIRIERAARAARKPAEARTRAPAPWWWRNAGTLWESRLTDVQTLRRLRWFGDLPPGQRDLWMFVAGNAMSWLAPPERLERELYALAREVAGWHDRESKSRMHAIFKRARMAARGETVEWEGERVDPRYRLKTQTILEYLEITDDEQRHMRTLITPAEKYRRKVERAREAGVISRQEYRDNAAHRRKEARRMAAEGIPYQEIGKALGVSVHTVRSYVYGRR